MTSKLTFNVSLKRNRKRIYISRSTIALLGNPSHLGFRYDERENLLSISATSKDDLDGYEIPKFFWRAPQPCEVARIAFFIALKHRLKWEDDSKYSYAGTLVEVKGFPAVVFNMCKGTKVN